MATLGPVCKGGAVAQRPPIDRREPHGELAAAQRPAHQRGVSARRRAICHVVNVACALFALASRRDEATITISAYRPFDANPCAILAYFSFRVVSLIQSQHAATP